MINHLRTLLLDESGDNLPGPDFPGEEYVDPSFRPAAMTPAGRAGWRALFGRSPDRAFRNWRLHQLMALVHASELAHYATDLDPRVTYWPPRGGLDRWDAYGVVAVTPASGLTAYGPMAADEALGRVSASWRVELAGTSLQVDRRTPPVSTEVTQVTFQGGRTPRLTLPGSGLQYALAQGDGVYHVDAVARPTRGPGQVLASARQALGARAEELFAGGEPYRTFRGLWERHQFLPEALAALALAVGYQAAGV